MVSDSRRRVRFPRLHRRREPDMEDGRCKLGLQGRLELVLLVESGSTLRAAAAALNVAPATAHRWWHRWRAASPEERASRASLRARPPVGIVSVGVERGAGAE